MLPCARGLILPDDGSMGYKKVEDLEEIRDVEAAAD
jgi:hypothetical protein